MFYDLKNFDDLKNSVMRASSELSKISENLKEEKAKIEQILIDINEHLDNIKLFFDNKQFDRATTHCKLIFECSMEALNDSLRVNEKVMKIEHNPLFMGKSSAENAMHLSQEIMDVVCYAKKLLKELQLAA